LETLRIRLLAVDPRDKRRRNICPCDVRERISATDPWIEIDDAVSLIAGKEIAIENGDMAELLANQLAEVFNLLVLYRDGAVGLAGAHPKFSFGESADVVPAQVIYDIETVLLARNSFLNQNRVSGSGGAGVSKE